jgi:hypothetical protein
MADEEKQKKKGRVRGALGRKLMKVPMLRRMYVRRILKFIDKSRDKGRRLPPDLYELSRQLSRVPESERAPALEAALKAGNTGNGPGAEMPGSNRELRRAASAQQRLSGKGQGYRPGARAAAPPPAAPSAPRSSGRTRPGTGRSKPAKGKSS